MSNEPPMKLYAISVAAMHEGGTATAIGVQSVIATLPEGTPVDDTGLQVARSIFPEHEGWTKHYSTAIEITQHFPLEPYRLVWHLEKDG
jgi:hypothetical protein